jgi:hypothetical protein
MCSTPLGGNVLWSDTRPVPRARDLGGPTYILILVKRTEVEDMQNTLNATMLITMCLSVECYHLLGYVARHLLHAGFLLG